MRRKTLSYLGLEAALFALYLVTAYFGLQTHAVNSFASLVWLPSGLSLAFLLIFGTRYWPAITLAAFAANFINGAPLMAAMGIGIGNTLEPLIGAYLLTRVVKLRVELNHVDDVISLAFIGALFSTLFSAVIGTTSLWLSQTISSAEYVPTAFAWWAGDAVSVLLVCPVLLVWCTRPMKFRGRNYAIELMAFFVSLTLATGLIFGTLGTYVSDTRLRGYLMFPLFIWSALRFGQRVTVSALLIFSVAAIWSTLAGAGPFATGTSEQNLLNLQLFIAVLSFTSMILAAAISEREIQAKQKDDFISVASHELRTPLTSIKTLTQTLQILFEKKGDRQSSSHMKHMNRQLDRLNRLVFKMLDLTRIQEGSMTLQKEKFTIGPLIREIVQEVAETTHHEIMLKGDTKTRISADRDRVGRALTNLLTNAAKYSPNANKIIVSVAKKKDEITVSIRDYGIGISREDQRHIFERFFQAAAAKKESRKESMGLGLFITKEIIEGHGGKIWVKSHHGKIGNRGSTFFFTIPLSKSKN